MTRRYQIQQRPRKDSLGHRVTAVLDTRQKGKQL